MMQQIYPAPAHSYRYELNKDFQFAAAHYVPHEDAGVCRRLHGHTYFVNVTVVGNDLNESGFLVNFKDIKDLIHKRFDHTVLNEDTAFNEETADDFPTTEVVARKFWEIVQEALNKMPNRPRCLQVFLRETPTSYVVFRPRKEDF
ncbi:6-carboxytetrahydropterin synthase QueD [Bacillus thermotolerans]|uniref:6-carboxytetrahydropterin synthase QueD n=1 Tax=Bacillus thermotolerans TaxID=1221996 RepID=UPI00057CF8E2|nr:6-carboxytetrahydropterin synthase QueD [Bacillus thermotolerans]KKB34975.1 6-carboxytetrahydropterin synthase [Bacillus thermotolerans]KKB40589.1 6-carboxytetrahydropterin synthase [Bacillus thermotolerans]